MQLLIEITTSYQSATLNDDNNSGVPFARVDSCSGGNAAEIQVNAALLNC